MFKEGMVDKGLRLVKKLIPKSVFDFFAPGYHWGLSVLGGVIYGFPSRSLKIIGVTGTKGKSTAVHMITRVLEEQGLAVAAVGSLGFKIRNKEWPNTLKMTMPGRTRLQKFLYQAKSADCEYVIMEITSEGLAQHRLAGVDIDCAVFTNLHREHLESHGSFANYLKAKQELFLKTRHIHILNIDDVYFEKFANFPAAVKITYGLDNGLINSRRFDLNLKLLGDFNEYNALTALAVANAYQLDLKRAAETLNAIESIPGRMEMIPAVRGGEKFTVVVDYAHTPDSLRAVYRNLRVLLGTGNEVGLMHRATSAPGVPVPKLNRALSRRHPAEITISAAGRMILNVGKTSASGRLIGVLGAAGGGRDKWKRLEFGKIASEYCDEIILTNEDPYDEDPEQIIEQIALGVPKSKKLTKISDRGEAIKRALAVARGGDVVIITGKGSETSIAVAGGKKVPWSDKEEVLKNL